MGDVRVNIKDKRGKGRSSFRCHHGYFPVASAEMHTMEQGKRGKCTRDKSLCLDHSFPQKYTLPAHCLGHLEESGMKTEV